jgi:hypothetical protein
MRITQALAGAIAAPSLIVSALALAPSAGAATYTGTFDCLTRPGTTFTAAAGDTINFTSLTNCGNLMVTASKFSSATASTGGGSVTPNTSSGTTYWQRPGPTIISFSITIASGVTGSFTISGSDADSAPPQVVATISIGSGGGGGSASSSTPAPITQQFGKPASGTCDAAQPSGLDWAGVASGGWANSWAQWMNSGNGGFVCTRTLVYSTTQSKWVTA